MTGGGALESGETFDDCVEKQGKTRGESVDVGVSVWHGAHIVVRESLTLHIRVLLPWVRGDSHTMRGVCWW